MIALPIAEETAAKLEWSRAAMPDDRKGVAAILRPKRSRRRGGLYDVERDGDRAGPLFVAESWSPDALAVVNDGRMEEPLTAEPTVPLDPILVEAVRELHPEAQWGRSARVYDGVTQGGRPVRERVAMAFMGGKCVAMVAAYVERPHGLPRLAMAGYPPGGEP